MRIKLNALMAGPHGVYHPGAIIDVVEQEAADLVTGGYASYVDAPPPAREEPEAEPKPNPPATRKRGRR